MAADPLLGNLLIVGGVGSGKSYLAACVRAVILARACPVLWINAATYMGLVKRGFHNSEMAHLAGEKASAAERSRVLVLDDLGKVHPSKDVSFVEEIFYSIVDARYRNELPIIVTTEWNSEGLAQRVGPSVTSRLQHDAVVCGLKKPTQEYRSLAMDTDG